eukprot:SAG11_NODE_7914_length_1081_cov_1.439919_1_plen_359_part_11
MKRQLLTHFPDLIPYFHRLYGQPSALHYSTHMRLSSAEGCRQGCTWGTFLYCLFTLRQLKAVMTAFPAVLVLAIADDVNFLGPPEDCVADFEPWQQLVDAGSEELQLGKCKLFSFDNDTLVLPCVQRLSAELQRLPSDGPAAGVKILGLPHGRPEFVQQFLRTIVASTTAACDAIRNLAIYEHAGATQAAYILLKYCALPRFVHVLRSLSLAETLACATAHDAVIMRTFSDILGVGDVLCVDTSASHPDWWERLAETARRHAALPHRKGGFALTPAVAIADACYVGGMTRVCQIIASDEHSAFPTCITSLPSTLHASALEPLCHLRDAWDSVALAIRVPNVPPSITMEATCGARMASAT